MLSMKGRDTGHGLQPLKVWNVEEISYTYLFSRFLFVILE